MATPGVEATISSSEGATTTSHTVSFPATVTANSLLLACIATNTPDVPSSVSDGWTRMATDAAVNATAAGIYIYYKDAAGTEGGGTWTFSTASARTSAHVGLSITSAESAADQVPVYTLNDGATANPDPAAITPAAGSDDYLWISFAVGDGSRSWSAFPTNQGDNNVSVYPAGCGSAMATADGSAATTFNPDTYTISVSDQWGCVTLAVAPAATASGLMVCQYVRARRGLT